MSDGFGDVVDDLAKPRVVTRRGALVYDGTGPRPVGEPSLTVAVVRLAIQFDGDGTQLEQQDLEGGQTRGRIRVWGSDDAFAEAYAQGDPDKVPLGWTGLRVGPTEDVDGPPGDWVDYLGRRYEVVAAYGHEEFFDGEDAGFHAYIAEERGPAS